MSRLQGVICINGAVTLNEIKTNMPIEMRKKANGETIANVVLLRTLLITCIFSIKIMKIMSRKEGVKRL